MVTRYNVHLYTITHPLPPTHTKDIKEIISWNKFHIYTTYIHIFLRILCVTFLVVLCRGNSVVNAGSITMDRKRLRQTAANVDNVRFNNNCRSSSSNNNNMKNIFKQSFSMFKSIKKLFFFFFLIVSLLKE